MKPLNRITTSAMTVVFAMGCASEVDRHSANDAPEPSSTPSDGGGQDSDANPGADAPMLDTGATAADADAEACAHTLRVTLRDFKPSHPDFEVYSGTEAFEGLVRDQLGTDDKPVYAHAGATSQTAGPEHFLQWYNDDPDANMTFEQDIELAEVRPGVYGFGGPGFFPLDGKGWGNSGEDDDGVAHNFHFTSEVHTEFPYNGGEVFMFQGDDDMWLFINGKLAIDLGGLHPELVATVDLDEAASRLGLQAGNSYAMDVFHAERHTTASNFYLETTIECFRTPGPK